MDIQLPQILFQIINFGVVAGVLTFLLFKPVKKMLEERSNRIEEAQTAADEAILEKKNLDQTRKQVVQQAENDAQAIVEEARRDAKRVEQEIIAQAEKTAETKIERERKQLAEDYKATVKDLRQSFVGQIAVMTEKVLGQAIDENIITKKLDEDIAAVIAKI